MEYNWNIEELINRRNSIIYHLNNCDKRKKEILFDLNCQKDEIDEQISLMNSTNNDEINNKVDSSNSFYLPKEIIDDYNEIDECFKKLFDYVGNFFLKEDIYSDEISRLPLDISDKDLIDLGREFFKSLPTKNNYYYKKYCEFTNPNNHLIKIIPSDELGISHISGISYNYSCPDKKNYFLITREKTSYDFITLCHELNHGIWRTNNDIYSNRQCFYELNELEGIWFNYLASKFLKDKCGINDFNNLDFCDYRTEYYILMDYYIISTMIKIYNKNKKISNQELLKKVANKLELDNDIELVLDSIDDYASERLIYLFSYLIRVDLEELDKNDPEYAFRCFENIMTGHDMNSFDALLNNGITFLNDDFKNLRKKISTYKKYGF